MVGQSRMGPLHPSNIPFTLGSKVLPSRLGKLGCLQGIQLGVLRSVSFDPALCEDQGDIIFKAVFPVSLVQVVTSRPQSSLLCSCANSCLASYCK